MGDWGRIILSPEAASSRFHDKVLVVTSGQTVTITRSSAGEKPETENAVFDCRVGIWGFDKKRRRNSFWH